MDIKVDNRTVIVFDLDDTLYNEMEYLRSAYTEIAKSLEADNWRMLFSRMYSLFRSRQDVFAFAASEYGVDKTDLLETYRGHRPKIHLFRGVMKTFDKIKWRGGKIGIITDGRSTTQRAKLEALGILDLCDKIVISEEVGTEKPDAANFQMIMDAFPDHSYLYMADNLRKDFVSPHQLGWKTVGLIDNGLNMHFDGHKYFDKEHRPEYFVTSFAEIRIV